MGPSEVTEACRSALQCLTLSYIMEQSKQDRLAVTSDLQLHICNLRVEGLGSCSRGILGLGGARGGHPTTRASEHGFRTRHSTVARLRVASRFSGVASDR